MKSYKVAFALLSFAISALFAEDAIFFDDIDLDHYIDCPCYLNDQYIGMGYISIDHLGCDEGNCVHASRCQHLIEPFVCDECLGLFKSSIQDELILDSSLLALSDINVEYIDDSQTINIFIPPKLLKEKTTSLETKKRKKTKEDCDDPCDRSMFVNISAAEKINHPKGVFSRANREPIFVGADLNYRHDDWLIEGLLNFSENSTNMVNRGDVYAIRDYEEDNLRLTLGDVDIPTIGFQSAIPLGGASITKNMSNFRTTLPPPVSREEFFLDTPSTVRVYTNGILYRTLELPAGPQRFEDFPINRGISNIEIVIEDAAGRITHLDYDYLTDSQLLLEGELEYSLIAGIPTYFRQAGRYQYRFEEPIFSGFFKYGATSQQTYGYYLQLGKNQAHFGTDSYFLTPDYKFQFLAGMSMINSHKSGAKASLIVQNLRAGHSTGWYWQNTITSKYFSSLSNPTKNNSIFNTSGHMSYHLSKKTSASIGAGLGLTRDHRTQFNLSGSMAYEINKNWRFSFQSNYQSIRGDKDEVYAIFQLNYSPQNSPWSVNANYNTQSDSQNYAYSYLKQISDDRQVNASIGSEVTRDTKTATGSIYYTGLRNTFDISHYLSKTSNSADSNFVGITNIGFKTAIAYADGCWAVSRPISNAFTIIDVDPELNDHKFEAFSASTNLGKSYSSKYFRPLVSGLNAYEHCQIDINCPDLPIDIEVEKSCYHIMPKFRSGHVCHIRKKKRVLVETKFLDKEDKPMESVIGYFQKIDDDEVKDLFFTSSTGKCQFELPATGTYKIVVPKQKMTALLEIPDQLDSEIFELDFLKLEHIQ